MDTMSRRRSKGQDLPPGLFEPMQRLHRQQVSCVEHIDGLVGNLLGSIQATPNFITLKHFSCMIGPCLK